MSVHTRTQKRAIAKAKKRVSDMIYCSGFDWQFTIDGQYTQPCPFKSCQTRRAQKLIDFARLELDLPPTEYKGGKWRDYI